MKTITRTNQLCGDPQPIARGSHRALKDVCDAEFSGDRRDVLHRSFVLEGRCTCGNEQVRRSRKGIQNFFGQAVRKPLLLLIRGHVDERQNGDGLLLGLRGNLGGCVNDSLNGSLRNGLGSGSLQLVPPQPRHRDDQGNQCDAI